MGFLFPGFFGARISFGLLVVRVVVGAAFILHGWPKIQNATSWMNGMPDPPPAAVQALAAVAEFGGGIALILGLLTPLAALGIGAVMVGALTMVHRNDPFVASGPGGSMEKAAVYLAIMVLLLCTGPGLFSVDALLFGRRAQPAPPPPR